MVATDDIDWAMQLSQHWTNLYFSRNQSAAFDWALMRSMNHSILSTGTFGWTSSWLAGGRVVYRPCAEIAPRSRPKVARGDASLRATYPAQVQDARRREGVLARGSADPAHLPPAAPRALLAAGVDGGLLPGDVPHTHGGLCRGADREYLSPVVPMANACKSHTRARARGVGGLCMASARELG